MGLRFWKRIKILPGVTLNLSKSGISISFGTRSARYTIGKDRRQTTVGIRGTGIYYTKRKAKKYNSKDKGG